MSDTLTTTRSWRATHKFARIGSRKAQLVMGLIRGLSCDEALEALRFNHQRASYFIGAVLKSAMANADEQEAEMGHLYVATESGDVHVIKLGTEYEVVATNTLADQFFVASPLAVEGQLILRSRTDLICVGDQ